MLCWLLLGLLSLAWGEELDQYVVNGDVATPHRYPWQLSLQRSGGHICGAVIVSNNFAITAAHCVSQIYLNQYKVKCGAHNIHVYESHRTNSSISNIVIHPEYNPNSQRPAYPNDIAVLKLSTPLTLDGYYCKAATLASGSYDYGNTNGVITGWGRLEGGGALPSRLKEGHVNVLTPSTCRTSYWGSTVNDAVHVCVKDVGDRIYGACNGDSGGPAQVGDTVIGLASFVASGCLTHYPSVYARVSNYINWIQSTINSLS